jgi:hypothetical protein
MHNLDLFRIHQTWTDLRQARVKDGFIFRVSRYFIDHWLHLLGPKAAWVVVDLQQRCYLDKTDFCQASLKELCAIASVGSATTMQAIVDKPLMRWFFAKETTRQRRADKVVRGKNRYRLQMSDPLTPEHQGQVAWLLAERLRDGTIPTVRGPDDLIHLVSDLPPLSSQPTDGLPGWATREPLNLRQIAFHVLADAGLGQVPANLADEAALRRAFADAQAHITRPTRIALATHYYRTAWVPPLGAINAWLIMLLRSRCYWNKESGEVRDTCVMSNQELADLLGASTRTVIRGLQHPLVGKFVTSLGRVYERRSGDSRKKPTRTRFQVSLTLDPLTPSDEAAFAEVLLSDAARYGLDSATGQMNMLDILDMMGQMTSDEIAHLRAQSSDRIEIRDPEKDESSDKIGIRGSRRRSIIPESSDKTGIGEHPAEPKETPETHSGDRTETRSPEHEAILSPFGQPEGRSEGLSSDKTGFRDHAGDKTGFRAPESSDKTDTIPPHSSDRTEKQYSNTFVSTGVDNEVLQQQQYPADAAGPLSALYQLLVQYGIEEPALAQILANSQVTVELARAWMLYADSQPSLKHKPGYVIQRLIKRPPDVPADQDLLLVARLGEADLTGFAQRRALELRMGASVSFGDERREAQYQAWLRFYKDEGNASREIDRSDETALGRDRGPTLRWRPDVG